LNKSFKQDFTAWQKKRFEDLEIVYVWADGIHLKAGIAGEDMCALVVIGADRAGKKHLLALAEGYRESTESWLEVLRDLKKRGLNAPAIAVADGALGFWSAMPQVWPGTKEQLCWLHKIRNILNKLPKSAYREATQRLRAIYLAREENGVTARQRAEKLAGKLIEEWRANGYEAAAKCFEKAIEKLFTMFEFPVEHQKHLRTTNPVESPFATVRLRTNATRRMPTRKSGLHLVFKLLEKAERNWQRITKAEKLREVKIPDKII
jgi:transposase-like protein